MPHPRAPREFVGETENLSIEAASYPRTGTGSQARRARGSWRHGCLLWCAHRAPL